MSLPSKRRSRRAMPANPFIVVALVVLLFAGFMTLTAQRNAQLEQANQLVQDEENPQTPQAGVPYGTLQSTLAPSTMSMGTAVAADGTLVAADNAAQ